MAQICDLPWLGVGWANMHLVVVHYHYRPGGVRRVVELGLAALVRHAPVSCSSVILAGGEAPEGPWLESLRAELAPVPIHTCTDRALGYLSEIRSPVRELRRHLRQFWARFFDSLEPGPTVVWAHNLGLGRNILMARELIRACQQRGVRLVLHHHDWWFEQRWQRWEEFRRAGVPSLRHVSQVFFAPYREVRHATINRRDAQALRPAWGGQVGWLPNPMPRPTPLPASELEAARRWLQRQAPTRGRPVWIVPCRLLRRKNLAEAILLTRWLRPEACLLTTGGVSSVDEEAYARTLQDAIRRHRWPVWLSALASGGNRAPDIYALMGAAEAVLLTSVLEGFGLAYLEAALVRRPLIARAVPHVVPDLHRLGFRFPQLYREVWVPTAAFDWSGELRRQRRLFEQWRRQLPAFLRRSPELRPAWVEHPSPRLVAFSSLTLSGQLELLAQPPEESWAACAPWNPELVLWQRRAAAGTLQTSPWPQEADARLSLAAYARRWWRLVHARGRDVEPQAACYAQRLLLGKTLATALQHPLLWARSS